MRLLKRFLKAGRNPYDQSTRMKKIINLLILFSTMAVSGDGLALRILIVTAKPADADSFLLATFDTRQDEFLPGVVHLGNCGPGRFISYPTVDQFDVLCPRTNRIRLIRVDSDSHETQNIDVVLPWERREGIALALMGRRTSAQERGFIGFLGRDDRGS